MDAPLIVTSDPDLREDLLRLAAAAGVVPDVVADPVAALRGWPAAPLVLLGADLAEEMARLRPVPRPGVRVVCRGRAPDELFRTALAVAAETVVDLPRSEGYLVDALTDLDAAGTDRDDGLVVGVVGGSGGAGATTLACALAQTAGRRETAVVVDCDPLGPGADRVLGLESVDGFRWDALCDTTGRLSARALRDALPHHGRVGALTWHAGSTATLQAFAVREAVSAARRGHRLVVLDLPRTVDPLLDELVSRCDVLLVVVRPTMAGVASGARLLTLLHHPPQARALVRGTGVEAGLVARACRVPVLGEVPHQRGVEESIELGLGPVRYPRGSLGRACRELLDRLPGQRMVPGPSVDDAAPHAVRMSA